MKILSKKLYIKILLNIILGFFLIEIAQSVQSEIWDFIAGETPPNALYFGLWSFHFNPHSRENDNANNDLLGFVYDSVFFGTGKNSFNQRTEALAWQRDLYAHCWENRPICFLINYRVGGIYGYDERLSHFAGESPIIPFISLSSDIFYRRLGIEFSWAGTVATAGFSWIL